MAGIESVQMRGKMEERKATFLVFSMGNFPKKAQKTISDFLSILKTNNKVWKNEKTPKSVLDLLSISPEENFSREFYI